MQEAACSVFAVEALPTFPAAHSVSFDHRTRRRNAPITVLDTTSLLHESYLRLVHLRTLSVRRVDRRAGAGCGR
jgi:hypothetical protein